MVDTGPGEGLTVRQLLGILRKRIVSIAQNKPVDLTLDEAREYEQDISSVLTRARNIVNSFHFTTRMPPELLGMTCSHLTVEDLFSASQVCHHWRSVLVTSPPLWTRISCRGVSRGLACLERCGSLPIKLQLEPPTSRVALKDAVLDDILLRDSKIISLTVNNKPNEIPQLGKLLMHSRPSVKQLHIYRYAGPRMIGWVPKEKTTPEVWQDLPSLTELFVSQHCIPIEKLNAPNLVHLALESTTNPPPATVRSVLDMLRGCPLLETLLLDHRENLALDDTGNYPPVYLPRLRSIEVGRSEVLFGLIPHLEFPQNIAAGFRNVFLTGLMDDPTNPVAVAIRHVLQKIDTRYITLAGRSSPRSDAKLLARFEGPRGTLEITTEYSPGDPQPSGPFFGIGGVLFCHSPCIKNVAELRIMDYQFDDEEELYLYHVNTIMPNVVSIAFFHCDGPHMLELLASPSSPLTPFPRLERVMVLGSESELEEIARRRKDLGVPLRTLVIGREPVGLEFDHLQDYTALQELVDNLQLGCHTEILEWGTENEILNFWSPIRQPEIACGPLKAFKFCRFDVSR